MQTSEVHLARMLSIWWRFPLALLLGALAGALGGLTASALSLGVLAAALVARFLVHIPAMRAAWLATPPSKRGGILGWLQLFFTIPVSLLTCAGLLWGLSSFPGSSVGLGGPALMIGLCACMMFGINERSQRMFAAAVGLAVAAGLGTLAGFLVIAPTSLLTLQLAGQVLLLAAGGGLLGALCWLLIHYTARKTKIAAIQTPAPATGEDTTPPTAGISRRAVLAGAAKGAIVLAAGVGMTWATRMQLPQFIPLYVYRGHRGVTNGVAWSPDGSLIASASDDKTVQVWRPFQSAAPVLVYRGHHDIVFAVAWSPNGRWIASTSFDKTTHIWDAQSGKLHLIYTQGPVLPQSADALAWSPDSTRLALVTPKGILIWNVNTQQQELTYTGHSDGGANAVAWSSDGIWLVSGGGDLTVQIWDGATGGTVATMPTGQIVYSVAWSPDGKRVGAGNDGTFFSSSGYPDEDGPSAQIFDALSGKQVLQFTDQVFVGTLKWSPDGKQIVTGGRDRGQVFSTLYVWDAASGSLNAQYNGFKDQGSGVNAAVWSPNGHWIAAASDDQTVQIWQPT